jgi:glycosyltransferase involved in cell wall biosynthesis
MGSPEVTVLMSVYNGEPFLRASIESILNQSFKDFEFIIIDDGSTDNSCKIIESYKDKRVRFYKNSYNIGLAASLNRGLKYAKADLIARQDADDISMPERLNKQVRFMHKNSNIVLIGSQGRDIDENGRNLGIIRKPVLNNSIKWFLIFDNPFIHTSVMFRRENVLRCFNGYNETFICSQDYELWSKIATLFPVANMNTVLVEKRNAAGSVTLNIASVSGREVCREVHDYNVKTLFSDFIFSDKEKNLISGFRFGLAQNDLKDFLFLFKRILKQYCEICPAIKKEVDFKVTVSLQFLRIADQAFFVDPLMAANCIISAAVYSLKTVLKSVLLLKRRLQLSGL